MADGTPDDGSRARDEVFRHMFGLKASAPDAKAPYVPPARPDCMVSVIHHEDHGRLLCGRIVPVPPRYPTDKPTTISRDWEPNASGRIGGREVIGLGYCEITVWWHGTVRPDIDAVLRWLGFTWPGDT